MKEICMVVWVKGVKNDIIMDTRRKLLLIRYRFGELIIDYTIYTKLR